MTQERNYDFRARHWQVHLPGRRNSARVPQPAEILLDEGWKLGFPADAGTVIVNAMNDFQDYLFVSMGISLPLTHTRGQRTLWMERSNTRKRGFDLTVEEANVTIQTAEEDAFKAVVHLEDMMGLEGAPVLTKGCFDRTPLYDYISIHSGCGIDDYNDNELLAIVHAGYDAINIMVKDFDVTAAGPANINDIIERAARFGVKSFLFNYMECYHHPDEDNVQQHFDAIYGELFRRYPKAIGIGLCGESLSFPSKDPHTSGKPYRKSVIDGIPDTRPSPGWYPCCDYPAYLECVRKAVHAVKPEAKVLWSTYNWGYTPLDIRRKFLEALPKRLSLEVTYEIFSQRELEGMKTPVMDYTISAQEPGYYFTSECTEAHRLGIPIEANCNVAGVAWDFGVVPYVPVPDRWLVRCRRLRQAHYDWGVTTLYATHHYGFWNCIASDIVKWTSWEGFEPDYGELFRKVAVRDYGEQHAEQVLRAWSLWGKAMDHYIASNEDQYGPWRVGASYPFIFQPNITRTMAPKEIQFPTAPHAHFGHRIIKTFYTPYENENQTPGFLRYPAELRSLDRMLKLWEEGLAAVQSLKGTPAGDRLEALGHFIRNSIRTTIHIKQWWRLNMRMQNSETREEALAILDRIEELAKVEMDNARDTIPAVETDSRLGWEPSMEYVTDKWHLEWKIRQVEAALREIATYRGCLKQ
ncbi:MAG: hypothetical protein IJJ33_12065 [Victivallales bacterium]|nr:hypothetical protein [Victivallales bacterium]